MPALKNLEETARTIAEGLRSGKSPSDMAKQANDATEGLPLSERLKLAQRVVELTDEPAEYQPFDEAKTLETLGALLEAKPFLKQTIVDAVERISEPGFEDSLRILVVQLEVLRQGIVEVYDDVAKLNDRSKIQAELIRALVKKVGIVCDCPSCKEERKQEQVTNPDAGIVGTGQYL